MVEVNAESVMPPLKVGADGEIMCPCGHEYLHFYRVVVSQAPRDECVVQDYEFKCVERICGSARPVVPSEERPSDLRGGGVTVEYWCESCGHVTRETRTFHKGCIYLSVEYDTSVDVHDEMFAAERDRGWSGGDHCRPYRR